MMLTTQPSFSHHLLSFSRPDLSLSWNLSKSVGWLAWDPGIHQSPFPQASGLQIHVTRSGCFKNTALKEMSPSNPSFQASENPVKEEAEGVVETEAIEDTSGSKALKQLRIAYMNSQKRKQQLQSLHGWFCSRSLYVYYSF